MATDSDSVAPRKRNKYRLAIAVKDCSAQESCALCGRAISLLGDLCLCREDDLGKVCGSCGAEHDPALTALLELARVADRIGRMGRHVLAPPLGALLELAHAAEAYTAAADKRKRLRKAG